MVYNHKEVSITWNMVYFSNDISVKVGDRRMREDLLLP